jgi:hypothetical protein
VSAVIAVAVMAHEKERMPAHGPVSGSAGMEPLACVSCRARKLKCDRTKPACTRCIKVNGKCVYPESRRKPATKRRNVKELEARLAQVEDYLKEVNKSTDKTISDASPVEADEEDDDSGAGDGADVDNSIDVDVNLNTGPYSMGYQGDHIDPFNPGQPSASNQAPFASDFSFGDFGDSQLIYTGLTEALPPMEMIEDL